MVPIGQVQNRLELELGTIQRRRLIFPVKGVIPLNTFDHKGIRLTKLLFRRGRVEILCQNGLEVCISCVPWSVLLASLFIAGNAGLKGTCRQQPRQIRGRGADDTGPAAEVEGSERDNGVVEASGLVSVGGIDKLWDVPNRLQRCHREVRRFGHSVRRE